MTETSSPLGEDLVRARQEVLSAAERGDDLTFAALAQRLGSLDDAQRFVRERACLRSATRGAVRKLELVERGDAVAGDTLRGHFAVFNEWTEIDSMFEGHFLERIAPGAFKTTFRDVSPKVTFQHGQDPFLGDKVLGKPNVLEEDDTGARYEVPLFRGLPDLLMEGLRAGEYGASFRFRVMREEFNNDPVLSDHNPAGLPERTIKEAHVPEFGPVTYPAYPSATAGVRASVEREIDAAPTTPEEEVVERSDEGTYEWPEVTDEEWMELWSPSR